MGEILIKRDIKLYMRYDSRPPCRLIYDTAAVLFLHQPRVILMPWLGVLPGQEQRQDVVASHGPCRGTNYLAARAQDWEVCTPPARCSRQPGNAWLLTLGPIRRGPRHQCGAAPPNLHPQRTLDPLSMCRMKRWARRETVQQNHWGSRTEQLLREKLEVRRDWPGGKALTVTLRSPRALADGPLLVAEKPGQVVKEEAAPIPVRRERHDRSAAMVTCSERTHKPSTIATSARWMHRH